MGKREGEQEDLFIAHQQLRSQSHPFYRAVNRVLTDQGFGRYVDSDGRGYTETALMRLMSVLIVALMAVSCRSHTREIQMESNVRLQVDEVRSGAAKKAGDDIVLRFTFTNISTSPVFLNIRGLLAGERSPQVVRDIWLKVIEHKTGSPIEFDCRVRGGAASIDEYSTLRPGASLSVVRDVRCFVFPHAGTYAISAYIDVPVHSDMVPAGAEAIHVPVRSNAIEITLE